MQRATVLGLLALAACSDALEQATSAGQVVVSVNTVSGTLSLVSVDDRTVSSLAVPPDGSAPRSLAVLGSRLVAPAGDSATLAVFDFSNGTPPGVVTRPLPGTSGTGGVAFQNDSVAWVANPARNTVTRVNLQTGDTMSTTVGVYPRAVVVTGGFVYVVNANVVSGTPAGPSWITVLAANAGAPPAVDSIPLTGTNAGDATLGADSLLYVVDAGTPGKADGRLSIVDPVRGVELVVVNGLGESPGAAVYHPSGRLLIASLTAGVLEVNTATRTLSRGPSNSIVPKGASGVAALTLDQAGRVYAFDPGDCSAPGALHILSPPPDYDDVRQIPVGICPQAAATILVP
jgi:hypothetical protein